MTTSEYDWWWGKRVNDNAPMPSPENTRPIEEHLQVISSELEKKLEAEKMRKGNNKAVEDLNSLKKIIRSCAYRLGLLGWMLEFKKML
ncbi:hypothetical protein Goklo_029211 [Gossypium klotzschianum]|uniref:NAB domain-containing protein n=1 Tax=Gossypium klotzschianum TaxID=34286 RepID=A0A7J8W5G1_9ROSI|nr:hypothetical protein [Gossypium klotzschianum]